VTAADVTGPRKSRLGEPITETELNVLKGYARGLENAEIGEELRMPMNTVKNHARRAFEKLGVHGRTQAVLLAIAGGLIPFPGLPGAPARLKPKAEPKTVGPPMLELPVVLYDEFLAVAAGVVYGKPPAMVRESARRALVDARKHVRDPRVGAGDGLIRLGIYRPNRQEPRS
jgi:DNA-binding CsgD family transcriptional regulator